MSYNISNDRVLDNVSCEFFENGDYKQVVLVGIVNDGETQTPVAIKATDHFEYSTLKDMSTCEFSPVANVVKAQACEGVKTYLVTELDALGLFDNPST